MSRDDLVEIMGNPRVVETYGNVEFWLYALDGEQDPAPSAAPVGLVDGRVVGWGREYYDAAVRGLLDDDGGMAKRG